MDRKLLLSLLLFFFLANFFPLSAGVASLTGAEILRLQSLMKSSPQAGIWEAKILKQAQEALILDPHPISQILTAGKLKGTAEKNQTQEALKDMSRMWSLALAYALSAEGKYEKRAEEYVVDWAKTCQPPTNAIDATNLEALLETYDLIRPQMPSSDQTLVDQWVRSVAQTLLSSDDPTKGTYWNNHKTHRLKIVALAAFVLNDSDLEKQTLNSLKSLMEKNLNPDGTTLDFHQRDALHYQVYDLEPFIRTSILYQRAQGVDLYSWKTSRGASVSQCVAYVLPFARGEKTHAEYVHTTVKFDIQRAENNEAGHAIGANFDPKAARTCLELAEFFQPELRSLVGTLAGSGETPYPTLQILLNEATRPLKAAVP